MKFLKIKIALLFAGSAFMLSGNPRRAFRGLINSERQGVDFSDRDFLSGEYKGIGNGFRPGLEVQVSVADGDITEITVVSHNEIGPQFYQRAMELIPERIVEKQSTTIDAISGATYTSHGIAEAVENALNLEK